MAQKIEIFTLDQLAKLKWVISVAIDESGAIEPDYTARASKTFPGNISYAHAIDGLPTHSLAEDAICSWASAIEYGNLYRLWRPTEMYFDKNELFQWIAPQQLEQFEKMYPECVGIAYQSALGMLYSQIGELFDIQAILAGQTTDGTVKILRWMLSVITAYNITSPSNKHSPSLEANFELVHRKITELKTGATTLASAPAKEEPNAWPTVVSNKRKMLG